MKLIRLITYTCLLIAVNASLLHAAAERRTALIIGNSQYDVGRLKNPTNDASDMADVMRRLGFLVILKKNAKQREIEEAIREFGHQLKKGGVGLFFYAGHGLQIAGKNYLIPIGASIETETDAKYNAIDVEMVLDQMANAKNTMNIVILDACRDNPLRRSMRSTGRGLAIISNAPQGTFITYSTSPGMTAADGVGRNSPYTSALLKFITIPGLPIEKVFKSARQRLAQETKNKQIPWELSSLQGEFYFVPERGHDNDKLHDQKVYLSQIDDAFKIKEKLGDVGKAGGFSSFTSPLLGAKFILIKPGNFTMGSQADELGRDNDEGPEHQVTISRYYYIQETEVTQEQWVKVMGKNPSHFTSCGADCPVEQVSWKEVQEFIEKLNQQDETNNYRLPTEAEWEYAARAGSNKAFARGDITNADCNADPVLEQVAWYCGNSGNRVHQVATKSPNEWGLYDMHGNVAEWVQDWKGTYSAHRTVDPLVSSSSEGLYRVNRGGSWDHRAKECRSAVRSYDEPSGKNNRLGFRLVRDQ